MTLFFTNNKSKRNLMVQRPVPNSNTSNNNIVIPPRELPTFLSRGMLGNVFNATSCSSCGR